MRTDQDAPFIVIYTDDGTAEGTPLRNLRENGLTDLVCEFGIATAMTATDPETGQSTIVGINIPGTDAAFELALDMVDRQIVAAMTGPGAWADIWRDLTVSVSRIERRRAAAGDAGSRIAARQLRIRLDVRPDPVWGQPLAEGSVWLRFLAALTTADPGLATVAAGFLGPQGEALTVDMIRASRGHTAAERDALGYGSLHPGGEGYTITTPVLIGGPGA